MVEQVDLEAACALWRSEGTGPSMPSAWEEAFARHRTASTAALTAERDALVARVAELEGVLQQMWARRYVDWCEIARKVRHDPT